MPFYISELLYNRGLERNANIKLLRHSNGEYDVNYLYKNDKQGFLDYTRKQKKNKFQNDKYVVVFIQDLEGGENEGRFFGVYEILGIEKEEDGCDFYDIEEKDGFDDLKGKIVVAWGGASTVFIQDFKIEKEVIKMNDNFWDRELISYNDIILNFLDLKEIVDRENQKWKDKLSLVYGIYLITDLKTGSLYVGSACGKNGIWGRWEEYIKTNGAGGNMKLKDLIEKDNEYAKNFQFSILKILPPIKKELVLLEEQNFKKKLGKIATALNGN